MKILIDCFVVFSVRDFEPKILIKGVQILQIHVESSKYKMICLKSHKSSEFAIFYIEQLSKILNYVDFIIL